MGTAAYGAYQSHQASEAASQGSLANRYGSKVQMPTYGADLGTPGSASVKVAQDVGLQSQASLPLVTSIANRLQRQNMAQRQAITGGTFQPTIQQEGQNLLGMEQGKVPADVVAQINRQVAQNLGGAQMPTGPGAPGFGGSVSQDQMARMLGMNSMQLMQQGMQMAPSWRSNVQSFLYTPQQAMQGFYMPQAQLAQQMAANQYQSQANAAIAAAQPNPQTVGQINTQMMQSAMNAQTAQLAGQALSGLSYGYKNYMNQGAGQESYDPNTGKVLQTSVNRNPYSTTTGQLNAGWDLNAAGTPTFTGNA